MAILRHLIICAALIAVNIPPAHAQSALAPTTTPRLKINYPSTRLGGFGGSLGTSAWPQQRPAVAAALHPAAKGAAIGAAAGAGTFAAFGLFYCTIGPNEVGECSNGGMWARGLLVWGAAGAAVGALIGALR